MDLAIDVGIHVLISRREPSAGLSTAGGQQGGGGRELGFGRVGASPAPGGNHRVPEFRARPPISARRYIDDRFCWHGGMLYAQRLEAMLVDGQKA